ncbi:toll/interleukin-1 receptor domain-containing protein [Streptomyces viridosporus]|uniref:toll/interleukin-1 receptor domain-containing protein n=1 Tax=Streptomyces viridosporus TaxID=67581 RepID=UPI0033227D3D
MERDAFISYSHRRDVPLAEALQKGLHGILRTPWLRRPGAKVFRDTTSLGASHDLGGSIKSALAGSRYFIYLASPEAADSRWVCEEIAFWRHNHGMDHFLIALSDGRIVWDQTAGDFDWGRTTALPPGLRGAFETEPLWVDLRPFRDTDDRSMAPGTDFRDKVVTLAAPLHGLAKDALDSEDLRMQRRAVHFLRGAVALLTVMLLLAIAAGVFAWHQRGEALARARTSASQALAARALDTASKDPRKAAQFALYADAVQPTGESAQALAQAVVANDSVTRHLQAGNEEVANFHGLAHVVATNVAISRNGNMLAYYSDLDPDAESGTGPHIHLFDITTGKALPSLQGKGWPQDGGGMEFSSDGQTLAVEAPYNQIQIWDVAHQKVLQTITASNGEELATAFKNLRAFAFSRDGQRLAAAFYSPDQEDYDFHVAVWDATTGRELTKELATPDSLTLGFDGSNRLLSLDAQAGTVRSLARNSTSWSAQRPIPGFPRQDRAQVTLSADGSKAYIGEKNELWDLAKGQRVTGIDGRDVGAIVMPGAKDGSVYAADSRGVNVYDAALRRQRTLGSFTWPVSSVSASGDGQWVAAGSGDGAVSLFSTTSFQAGVRLPNKSQVRPADLAPDKWTAFRTGQSGTDVWAITDEGIRKLGHVPLKLVKEAMRQDTVIASADGSRAIVAQQGVVSLWDLHKKSRVRHPWTSGSEFVPLSFLPDGTHVVGTTKEEVQVLDTRSWSVRQSVPFDREASDMASAISADRTTLALVQDKELTVWKWETKEGFQQVRKVSIKSVWTMYGHEAAVSAKGELVAVMNYDGRISILNVSTGRFVHSTSASTGGAALAFSSDTAFLVQAFGSEEESGLQFWDAATGEARGAWMLPNQGTGQDNAVTQLFTGNNGAVVAFGMDGSLVRRTVDKDSWRKVLCKLAPDKLPHDEYDRYLGGLDVDTPCKA